MQGPASEAIVSSLVPEEQRDKVAELKYYAVTDADVDGIDVLLARTGYTGEDGFELYVPNVQAVDLWRSLLTATIAAGGSPAGLACRDTLRLEAGMALYGHELSLDTNPYQAGSRQGGPAGGNQAETSWDGMRCSSFPSRRWIGRWLR